MRRKLALICATLLAVTLFITACKIHEDPKPKIIRLNNIDIYFEEASQASKPGPRRPETNPLFPIPEEVLLPQRKEEERPLLDFSNENIRYTNGKIMISLVEFCDALGIGMKWDGYTRTVNIVKDGIEICLNYGKNEAVVNGENVKLDSPMSNINGKTMIPLLDITSALKIETKWDEDTKILTIINYINKINNSDRLDNNLLEKYSLDKYKELEHLIKSNINGIGHHAYKELEQQLRKEHEAYDFENGDKYIGEWEGNIRTGKGVYYWSNKEKYIGDFINDNMVGRGILYLNDGMNYLGDFLDGEMTGKGIVEWPDGKSYIGQISKGVMSGLGIFVFPDGSKYVGLFKDGSIKEGALYLTNDFCYLGEFDQDNPTVNGIYWKENEGYLNLKNKCQEIVDSVIKENMSDIQKVKALHNYLTINTKYYTKKDKSIEHHTAYGILKKGQGVCSGYAEAMKLLCSIAGIECFIVNGEAKGGPDEKWENHSWNIVKIEDRYYHVDVTFDDPVPDMGSKTNYGYFRLTDKQISKDHKWEREMYPQCN